MSERKLSTHDHGNCELCDLLETERAALKAKLEATERLVEEAVPMVVECYQTWPESNKSQPQEWLQKTGRLK